ncbi:MAG: hypothetical protein LBN22_09770 [Clostridiales Family XIII bacterium]|nr:hypothetical protein [Clostridiales Family XIII bacterium]
MEKERLQSMHTKKQQAKSGDTAILQIQLIITCLLSIAIICALLVSTINIFSHAEYNTKDETPANVTADFIKNKLDQANEIVVIQSNQAPTAEYLQEEFGYHYDEWSIIYLSDRPENGTNIVKSGYLYYKESGTTSISAQVEPGDYVYGANAGNTYYTHIFATLDYDNIVDIQHCSDACDKDFTIIKDQMADSSNENQTYFILFR